MKKLIAIIVALSMTTIFFGCAKKNNSSEQSDTNQPATDGYFDGILENGVLKIGIVLDSQTPMAFTNETYNIVGFDMDLGSRLHKYINETYGTNIKIQFTNVSATDKYKSFDDRTVDIILDRCALGESDKALYSDGYIKDRLIAVSERSFSDISELSSHSIGVLNTGKAFDTLTASGANMISSYTSVNDLFAALYDERVDAVVVSELSYLHYLATSEKEALTVSDIKIGDEEIYAVATPIYAQSLVNVIDKALLSFSEDGILNELADKWFKSGNNLVIN